MQCELEMHCNDNSWSKPKPKPNIGLSLWLGNSWPEAGTEYRLLLFFIPFTLIFHHCINHVLYKLFCLAFQYKKLSANLIQNEYTIIIIIFLNKNVRFIFSGLFTPSAETENYVLGHFRWPNIRCIPSVNAVGLQTYDTV
jgi:hypothetical protein